MVRNLFDNKRPERRGSRVLSIFGPPTARTTERVASNPRVVNAFGELDDMVDLAGQALEAIKPHAQLLVVPIEDDDNEVRAAHLRVGGDGKFITFAQFQYAIDEMKRSRADYAFNTDLKGWGFGNKRKTERKSMSRALANFAGKAEDEGGLTEELAGMGLGILLLFGLNELLGMNHSKDHSSVVSGKLPPATETGGIVSQILRSVLMMKFLHGMTEEAVESYTKMDNIQIEGVDIGSQIKEAFNNEPPASRAFDLMRAGLASSDQELIARHSIGYAGAHVGDGFETWYAYLTTREIHERGLREQQSAHLYRQGFLRGSDKRAEGITKLASAGVTGIARMQQVLGTQLNSADACCLTRFLLAVDLDFLDAIRAIISMAVALLESLAAAAMSATMELMMSPWAMIRSEVVRLIDGVLDKVVQKIVDAFDIDSEAWDIIKACTPVSELIQSVLDQIEWIKRWYKEMLELLGGEIEGFLKVQMEGWETIWGIKKAKEQLLVLDRIIVEKQAMLDSELPENQIFGIIDEVKGYRKTYDIPVDVMQQVERDMKVLVSSQLSSTDRERIITNIDNKLAAAGVPDNKRAEIKTDLFSVAEQRNDTKLNQVLGYVEEAVGENNLAGDLVGGVNDATREITEWCRNLGDWDRLKGVFGAETNEPTGEPGNG